MAIKIDSSIQGLKRLSIIGFHHCVGLILAGLARPVKKRDDRGNRRTQQEPKDDVGKVPATFWQRNERHAEKIKN